MAVLAGSNQTRNLPAFFERAFQVPVRQIASPGFSLKKSRAISIRASILHILGHLPDYRRSLATLGRAIQEVGPDLIINFLEPLMGVYNLLHRHEIPVLAVGHQFMIEHPQFVQARQYPMQRFGMKMYLKLTAARSARLALSFYSARDIPEEGIFVSPPILRRQLFDLRPHSEGGHLQVYLLNHGYAPEILCWHEQYPDVPIHCFYDKPGAPAEEVRDATLTFHRIDGEKFLRMMAASRGVACTAGFESVSEAAYLGKPVLMVPVENHYEQYLNSCDAEYGRIGLRDRSFQLSRLLAPADSRATTEFRNWVGNAEATVLKVVETVAARAAIPEFRPVRKPFSLTDNDAEEEVYPARN